uniref:NADH-quinone oxidoreductase subunit N n=1 Tax=Candidatus Kentrum sp. SD TaxID=2126332 RepID=A0A451BI75_9GAMM|nr:MAG: NADH dehydrogenase subunit N [Candidatus Kentron sp. SD]VFK40666.1 MAG: NADH dehydrogenase subunit N [Candidatus Kentron sp. SD]VFK78000.1 MAG: NADH dehydrogenase subunit N [Candidatus Kentron sp. SD]
MTLTMQDFFPILPEIFLLAMIALILVVDVFLPEHYRIFTYQLSQVTLVGVAALVLVVQPEQPVLGFHDTFVNDSLATLLKTCIVLVTFFVFVYSKPYLRDRNLFNGEYFILGLMAVLGMLILVSAHSLLTVYLGLELLSLSLYAMVGLHRESAAASEAAMKYFVLGALASGMLLYGMSLLYGVTGTLDLAGIARYPIGGTGEDLLGQSFAGSDLVLTVGLIFVLVGIAFKLGAAPFHMWVPDVYQGAPTAVTLFIGTAPKIAAFAMLMRLLVDGLIGLQGDWVRMLIILAVLSMAIGNIVAISQTNLKRMLAYSTIAHAGFLLLGVIAGTKAGFSASVFYVLVYTLMAAGGFGMIILLSRAGAESDQLDDFKGLNERSPWYAFLMLILMLSMAGVPPFLGFWAKWSVLREIVAVDMAWLAVVAVCFAVIGLFYYLRVVRLMYFNAPHDRTPIQPEMGMRVMLGTNALAILALGLYPGALMTVCVAVISP